MPPSLRVAVVDDHQLFREGIVELLGTAEDITVVGQAGTAAAALDLVVRTRPHVVLLDLDMPDTVVPSSGPGDATRRICGASPGTSVVILTMHDEAELVRALLDAGAAGYLLKTAGREELLNAVRAAGSTGAATVSLPRDTVVALSRSAGGPGDILTPRERAVLTCLAAGSSNRAIASELHVSEATVKRHLATVYTKLGVSSRLEAVIQAQERGLLRQR
ncbi:response regulator transcription factor [Nocardioides jiangxiensis]|uniref:Response regulator transcription factor n=1 Tax=Nocardioides jiangxiensis TaxID=3064524 RepID=A0ABT9AXG3_9ACTN|nr:response regulator transcription factor [Nocardioides sp. WY-20]MDO7867231.1 response regulator transcription factor [Nocardioides sp. WY-20]